MIVAWPTSGDYYRPSGAVGIVSPRRSRGSHPWLPTAAPPGRGGWFRSGSEMGHMPQNC